MSKIDVHEIMDKFVQERQEANSQELLETIGSETRNFSIEELPREILRIVSKTVGTVSSHDRELFADVLQEVVDRLEERD
ncbi:hypothetical protein [Oceanobacillus sp. FSL W7-1281]|uniref:hypothetical protein n=1 Tax=Oceanobacillus sp. FSL W7-1281 TaxID=2921698 RepID=UPI0030DA4E1D